jgi:hypothetical protein
MFAKGNLLLATKSHKLSSVECAVQGVVAVSQATEMDRGERNSPVQGASRRGPQNGLKLEIKMRCT